MIRKAVPGDARKIAEIYEAIHDAEEQGRMTVGWCRGVYPVLQTAEAAIERGDMFVELENGQIVAAAIINQQQVDSYAGCHWRYAAPDNEVMVLHTLVVDPNVGGHGYGKAFVRFYEDYALRHGCRYLRMDTQAKNKAARSLYGHMGYQEPGIVKCVFNGIPNIDLVCLEKKLDE